MPRMLSRWETAGKSFVLILANRTDGLSRLGEFRHHHPARPAPRGSIVDDQRHFIRAHCLVVNARIEFAHPGARQLGPSGPAFRPCGQLSEQNPVGLSSGRANEFHCVLHHSSPKTFEL